jgi:hypothetical protein
MKVMYTRSEMSQNVRESRCVNAKEH